MTKIKGLFLEKTVGGAVTVSAAAENTGNLTLNLVFDFYLVDQRGSEVEHISITTTDVPAGETTSNQEATWTVLESGEWSGHLSLRDADTDEVYDEQSEKFTVVEAPQVLAQIVDFQVISSKPTHAVITVRNMGNVDHIFYIGMSTGTNVNGSGCNLGFSGELLWDMPVSDWQGISVLKNNETTIELPQIPEYVREGEAVIAKIYAHKEEPGLDNPCLHGAYDTMLGTIDAEIIEFIIT